MLTLWWLRLQEAIEALKRPPDKVEAAAEIARVDEELMKRYPGSARVGARVWGLIQDAVKAKDYETFVRLANHYMQHYSWSPRFNGTIFQHYLDFAKPLGEDGGGDVSRLGAALAIAGYFVRARSCRAPTSCPSSTQSPSGVSAK